MQDSSYLDLKPFLQASNLEIFGTALKGESIYGLKSKINSGVLIFGNEANGISTELLEIIDKKITIPRSKNQQFPESLNLASSLAIFLHSWSCRLQQTLDARHDPVHKLYNNETKKCPYLNDLTSPF